MAQKSGKGVFMYSDSETRSNVLEEWCTLAGLVEFIPYIEFYTKNGILSSPSDLYKLNLRHLYTNPEIPDDAAYPTLEKIDQAKDFTYARVLIVLLPDLDPLEIREIVKMPSELEELVEMCKGSLYTDALLEELERLQQVGVQMTFGDDPIFDEAENTPFADKNVVVAGKLSDDHETVKSALASLGASIQDKIDKDTDFLILGEGAPEETDLAIKIGVRVLTEPDVAAMLGVV